MQCARHGIAAGPDGRCVLCRRETAADSASASKRWVWIAGVGLGLAVVALLLARPLGAVFSPPIAVAPEVPSAVARAPESASEPPEPEPEAERTALAEPKREAELEAADTAPPPEASTDPQPAGSASPTPAASVAATPPTPAPSAPARPTQEAVASAIRATPITMFSTTWCGVCARARAFLDANGLRYSERDIDHDENAREELERRTGKSSIPTFEIDGQLLTPGFSENSVMAAIAKSAQRRLGIEKLELRRTQ